METLITGILVACMATMMAAGTLMMAVFALEEYRYNKCSCTKNCGTSSDSRSDQ